MVQVIQKYQDMSLYDGAKLIVRGELGERGILLLSAYCKGICSFFPEKIELYYPNPKFDEIIKARDISTLEIHMPLEPCKDSVCFLRVFLKKDKDESIYK
jgi:hypothetical protein